MGIVKRECCRSLQRGRVFLKRDIRRSNGVILIADFGFYQYDRGEVGEDAGSLMNGGAGVMRDTWGKVCCSRHVCTVSLQQEYVLLCVLGC